MTLTFEQKRAAAQTGWVMLIMACVAAIFFALGQLYEQRNARYLCDKCVPLIAADTRPYKVRP